MKIQLLPSGPLSVNTYLVIDEETNKGFIVDPGGYDKRLVEEIENNEYEIQYIILTHGHSDHIGGVEKYQELFPRIKVVASEKEIELLKDPNQNESMMVFGKNITVNPEVTVNENDEIIIGNLHLKFIMTPGHTKGGMCILLDDILFSGDTLFRASIGRTDFKGGSFEEIKDSIRNKLFTLDDNIKVLPGHMDITTIGYEKEHNPFV